MITKLKKYQKEGVLLIEKFKGRVLLSDEVGLGKTIQTLNWVERHPELSPVIVICPASLKWVWEMQAKQHIEERGTVIEGTKPKSLANIKLIIINYEILQYWLKEIEKVKPMIMVCDESHYLKSRNAKRTRAVKVLSKNIPHIICLSGTPLTNRPSELWTTLNIIRPDLYPSFFSYAFKFCKPVKKPWGWEYKGASNLDVLHENLKNQMMIRRLKVDVLTELPEITREIIPFTLKNFKKYREVENDFINWLRKKSSIKAKKAEKAEAMVKLGYLIRLAARLKLKKVGKWIDDFLEGEDGKLVLFCTHRKIIKKLHEAYKDISVVVDGHITGHKRKLAILQFQRDKKTRLFIGNMKAAGVGIDLWAASTCAFVELDFVPGNHTQAEGRLHRIGQKDAVTTFYLVAKDTIEEKLCKLIQEKQEVLTATLDGKKGKIDLDIFDKLQKSLLKGKK
jgi:SWI/SNF-related matrix-associated actin-dependent regulator of chromatin subfamily A-like protein 1